VSDGATHVDVAVVGSANVDLIVPVERLPEAGETVLGGDHRRAAGGKGANQAVAASRLGRAAALVGRVGDDDLGDLLRASLEEAGVFAGHLLVTAGVPSGVALITVDATGENTIAVSPGANHRVTPSDVAAAHGTLRRAAVTLVSLEIPLDAVAAAVAAAGGTVVLNPAPAAPLPAELLAHVDVLVPNRSELGVLAGVPTPTTIDEAVAAARSLPADLAVVVTLGADGAVVVDGGVVEHLRAEDVEAVDATGAGDAFCGGLADGLSRGLALVDAAGWAVRVAGTATTRWGAQPSMPTPAEVRAATARPTT
jgi:ribokinase